MDISRELALEIFGLHYGKYTEKDLYTAYRRLARTTHPDTVGEIVLYRFIQECKEILEKNSHDLYCLINSAEKENSHHVNDTEAVDISLDLLYDNYVLINKYKESFNIRNIETNAKIFVHPIFKKQLQKYCNITLSSPFNDFLNTNGRLVNLSTTIYLPEEFKNYKIFKVTIIIENKKFTFFITNKTLKTLTSKHTFKKDFSSDYFLTRLNLSFVSN